MQDENAHNFDCYLSIQKHMGCLQIGHKKMRSMRFPKHSYQDTKLKCGSKPDCHVYISRISPTKLKLAILNTSLSQKKKIKNRNTRTLCSAEQRRLNSSTSLMSKDKSSFLSWHERLGHKYNNLVLFKINKKSKIIVNQNHIHCHAKSWVRQK